MKTKTCKNHRFVHNNDNTDLTFKFYEDDDSIVIIDNNTNGYLLPGDLTGEAKVFYALKRIEYIREKFLTNKRNKSA